MLEQIMNTANMDYLPRGMQAATMRHEVISDNIANVNTPKFKRSYVRFEDLLARELHLDDEQGKLDIVRTHDRHMPIPMRTKAQAVIEKDETTGLKPEYLAAKISKIVRKKNPRYHYIISTLEQRLSVTLKAILPPSWFARILGAYYHL
jgi:flagellar basal-body rod protein FlgB